MAKLYWIGGLIALGGLLIFGILQYGVSIGRAKCENAQNQAIQVVNQNIETTHQVFITASAISNAKWLCESSMCVGGCEWRGNACQTRNNKLSSGK